MDNQNPTNNDWGSTGSTGGSMGTGSGSGTGAGSVNSGGGLGASNASGFGVSSGTDAAPCPTCGHSKTSGTGLEQFLGRLGISDDMMNNLKGHFQNVDIDEYLNTARTYLKDGGDKASSFAKENPGKVAAGVAALALGAGLIYAATNRDSKS